MPRANSPATPLTLVLLGDPGAGKATQTALLKKKFRLYDLDMGRELHSARQKDSKLNKIFEKTIDIGKLAPTKIVREILHQAIVTLPTTTPLILDGTPKMAAEARLVAKWFTEAGRDKPLVVYLDVPLAETVKRIAKRKGYNATAKRADDNMVALRNRIKYYRTNIAQVVKFFKTQYPFIIVSGLGTPTQVHRRLSTEIKKHLTQ